MEDPVHITLQLDLDSEYTSQQLLEVLGVFETFLYVEQYFIPKKLIFACPFEGWANQATVPEQTNVKQKQYTSTNFAFFGTFLHVEQEYRVRQLIDSGVKFTHNQLNTEAEITKLHMAILLTLMDNIIPKFFYLSLIPASIEAKIQLWIEG